MEKLNFEVGSSGPNKLIIGILVVLILGLFGSVFVAGKYKEKYKEQKSLAEDLSLSINTINDTVRFYRVKWENGAETSTAQIKAVKLEKSNLEKLYKSEIEKAKQLGAKSRDINAIAQVQTENAGTKIVPVYVDSLKQLTATYTDSFTLIRCAIRRNGLARFDFSIRDSIYILDIYKRHRLLFGLIKWKERQNKMIVTSMNPNTTIRGFTVHKVIQD